MEEQTQKNAKPREEQNLCQCGSPTEIKPVQVGWGTAPIQICTNPNCPYKQERKKKAGWGE